jgi:hypothetical protein
MDYRISSDFDLLEPLAREIISQTAILNFSRSPFKGDQIVGLI